MGGTTGGAGSVRGRRLEASRTAATRNGAGRQAVGARPAEREGSIRQAMHDAAARELARVRAQIAELLEPETQSLRRYRRDYDRSVPKRGRPVPREHMVRAALRTDVLLIGDYHTLPEAQRAALDLAMEIAIRRPMVVCLEMLQVRDQPLVDAYLAGRLSDGGFLEAIAYTRTWPFPWSHYRPLLHAARRGGWPVVAIDSPGSALLRDRRAAVAVADSRRRRPEALHLVLIGDLHLAPNHLPGALAGVDPNAKLAVVHQNEPVLYDELVRRGIEHRTTALLLGPGRYCLMNATPLRRERSYLTWIEGRWLESMSAVADPESQFAESLERVAALIGVPAPPGDWHFVTGPSLEFLLELQASGATPARLTKVRREIVEAGRVLIPELGLVYARAPVLDDLGELTIEALMSQLGEPPPLKDPERLVEAEFLVDVRRQALAFVGSCLLHPLRAHATSGKWGDPLGEPMGAASSRVAREIDQALVARASRRTPLRLERYLTGLRTADAWAVARRVGRRLGRRLFQAIATGAISRAEFRRLLAPPRRRDPRRREREAAIDLTMLALRGEAPPPARGRTLGS